MFNYIDKNKEGYISGMELKKILIWLDCMLYYYNK
jgi:Ca2+-binding EF-hand superfamily protein